jgi:AcrR family transcriptional regulator
MDKVNKQTKPTLRQRQAQATRSQIVAAAQELFLKYGYSCTTIEAIAEQAGVAVSTVYAVFKSKRGILRAIRQAWHGRSHIQEVVYADSSGVSAGQRLDHLAEATQCQWETGSDVLAIYTGASAADADAAAELAEAIEGRRKGLRTFAKSLEGHLRPGLSVDQAAAILQGLCLPGVYDELVRHSGWSAETYIAWLAGVLKYALLGQVED